MKSTRRHELQTNELADALGRAIERLRPHGRSLAYGGGVLLVLLFLLVILPAIRGGPAAADVVAATFHAAQASGQTQPLRDVLKDHPEAGQAPAARLLLAERLLAEAVAGTKPALGGGDPKARAATLVAEARDLYERAAQGGGASEPMARVGLALVAVQQGDVEKGRAALQEVVEKWPMSVAAARARVHVEVLANYQPVAFSDEPLETEKPEEKPAPPPAPTKPDEAKPAPTPKG